ncbi:endoplasmic reticulum vesicle transporter-domain-containing protein [Calycina marina]|uniref:Endoplasmic reticulum-Golgi intermediate compartment protein n=1 Tax=Calycina marina TaxID=1763456 RepID=A0A9P8CB82_9HELO|nr:endoplasmic reticulum vesicle transporter-domain-containing protein [Calycina marina]
MNGFSSHGLDEDAFGEKSGNIVQAFDYFPKAKPQFIERTSSGGKWTIAMLIVSSLLVFSEFRRWWQGMETHTFAVEKGVGHNLQINLDIVMKMRCEDIHINVQDAAGDRILAGGMLKKDPTMWFQWADRGGVHRLGSDENGRVITGEDFHEHEEGFGEEHVHDIIAAAGGKRQKFRKTPKLRGGRSGADSCRMYGSLEVNKVQGDFHITARGHGYTEYGANSHLDHKNFNFSHIVSELSFGQFYPSLLNPLDKTVSTTPNHFHKFQYFLSVVPTVYSAGRTISTNQYAVTEQSHIIGERAVPGVFFKYDIEPMLLSVEESRDSFLKFVVKIVNVFSGVLVAGHWGFTLMEWVREQKRGRMNRRKSEGVLSGKI